MSQPSVVFIDDSATMREVIKIAFRREDFQVFAFADANAALDHVEAQPPDVLITDVIMPDHDGYQVCEYMKENARLSHIPVVLMSGVVNREVADRAFSVKAAELVRKPFQPQDLITRVKQLLRPQSPPAASSPSVAAATLSNIFATPTPLDREAVPPKAIPAPAPGSIPPMPQRATAAGIPDSARLKVEVLRLEGLLRKVQAELTAEREYSGALEEHIKTLQEAHSNVLE